MNGTETIAASPETLADLIRRSRWLGDFERSVYSQHGEDGVLEKALSILPVQDRWCVEFGAWDGKYLSNTFYLVEQHQYRVLLVEGDEAKYRSLTTDYPFPQQAVFLNRLVGWSAADGLDAILSSHPIPLDFDLLSIDVDGNDFHIWKATERYRPKLVLIEYNETASNRIDFVQPADGSCNQSSSPAALIRLAKQKGYELIYVTKTNLLFVEASYDPLFEIPDNSLAVMRDEHDVTTVYIGFDGTLHLDGPARLPWHVCTLHLAQPLPALLRTYPPAYSLLQRVLFRLYKMLFSRRFGTA